MGSHCIGVAGARRRRKQACSSRLRANGLAFACSSHSGTVTFSWGLQRAWGWWILLLGKVDGIGNKRYTSRGRRRKRVHGSLGGGSVDLCGFVCFSNWGLSSFSWRRASTYNFDYIAIFGTERRCYFWNVSRSFGLNINPCRWRFWCSSVRCPNPVEYTALVVYILFRWREQEWPIKAARS